MSRVAEPTTITLRETPRAVAAEQGAVDYVLHGIVRTRLLDATPADEAVVRRQLGPLRADAAGEPDITIRFVDRLETTSPVRYLGLDDAGFTGDAFLILRSTHKAKARVQIDLASAGAGCEIMCERGLPAVPLLIAIVNLTALAKGVVPLHASAFTFGGRGVLLTGWAKAGKSEALLSFMARGAEYVGDEWVYLPRSGREMFGIPEPIRLWDWHLEQMPQFRQAVSRGGRSRMRLLRQAERSLDWLNTNPTARRVVRKDLSRFVAALGRQPNVQIPPAKLFGSEAVRLSGRPDVVFLLVSRAGDDYAVEPVDPQEVAARMLFSNQVEQVDLLAHYWRFRYAFPEAANPLIEDLQAVQADILREALAGKPAYVVYHPHPVAIPELFRVMRPFVEGDAS